MFQKLANSERVGLQIEKILDDLTWNDPDVFTDTPTNPSTFYNHEDVAIDEIINNKITGSEVKKAIRKLKNGKSAGEDNISPANAKWTKTLSAIFIIL